MSVDTTARGENMIGEFWNSVRKPATHFLLGIAGLALITLGARLFHLQPGAVSLLYLIVVVFVSLRAGFASSVAVSVVAVVYLHYYFVPLFTPAGRKNPLASFPDHGRGNNGNGVSSAQVDGIAASLAI